MLQEQWRQGFSVLSDGGDAEQWVPVGTGSGPVGAGVDVAPGADQELWLALSADPQEVRRVGVLPAEGVLAQAPLGDYDVIELSVFDHPVARLRWTAQALGQVERVGESALPDDAVVPVLVEAALDEAWQDGAEVVTTLVPSGQAPLYKDAGWTVVESVRRG